MCGAGIHYDTKKLAVEVWSPDWLNNLHAQLSDAQKHDKKVLRIFLSLSHIEELILRLYHGKYETELISTLFGVPLKISAREDVYIEIEKLPVNVWQPYPDDPYMANCANCGQSWTEHTGGMCPIEERREMPIPTEPGFYWYKYPDDWDIVKVFSYQNKLYVQFFGTEDELPLRLFHGEWGPKIEPPDPDGVLIETKEEYDARKKEL